MGIDNPHIKKHIYSFTQELSTDCWLKETVFNNTGNPKKTKKQ